MGIYYEAGKPYSSKLKSNDMNSVNDAEQPSKSEDTGLTPSTIKLKRIIGTLARLPDADAIRNRVAAAKPTGSRRGRGSNPREEKQ